MKFTIEKALIEQALDKASKGVSKSTVMPIMNGILIKVTEEEVILTASNYDVSIKVVLPVDENIKVEVPGSTVLQTKAHEIIKKLRDGEVHFETNEMDLTHITSHSVAFELPGQDADEYPQLPDIPTGNDPILVLKGKEFQDIARKTTFCASESDNRPILQAIMFDIKKDCTHIISTDSLRMSSLFLDTTSSFEKKLPIPAHAITEMTKVFDFSLDIEIHSLSETQAVIKNGNTIFIARLLEGKYPVTAEQIPTTSKTQITLDRIEFLQALEQLSILIEDGNRSNIVKMTVEGLMITLESSASQKGKGKVELPYLNFNGEPIVIGFSGKFALNGVKSLTSKAIDIQFVGGPYQPILITQVEGKEKPKLDCLHMLSPVKNH